MEITDYKTSVIKELQKTLLLVLLWYNVNYGILKIMYLLSKGNVGFIFIRSTENCRKSLWLLIDLTKLWNRKDNYIVEPPPPPFGQLNFRKTPQNPYKIWTSVMNKPWLCLVILYTIFTISYCHDMWIDFFKNNWQYR